MSIADAIGVLFVFVFIDLVCGVLFLFGAIGLLAFFVTHKMRSPGRKYRPGKSLRDS